MMSEKNIDRRSAFCIRQNEGPPGVKLMRGLLFSPAHAPSYHIGWMAVSSSARSQGVGSLLLNHILGLITSPAEITVTTFGEDNRDGLPARLFYLKHGFLPAERAPDGMEGGTRQVFRLKVGG
jgi:GNAT superfamily N-acetyltransferase